MPPYALVRNRDFRGSAPPAGNPRSASREYRANAPPDMPVRNCERQGRTFAEIRQASALPIRTRWPPPPSMRPKISASVSRSKKCSSIWPASFCNSPCCPEFHSNRREWDRPVRHPSSFVRISGKCDDGMQWVTSLSHCASARPIARPVKSEIKTDRPRQPRQNVGNSDIRKKTDLRFRHRPFVVFAGDAMRVVGGQPGARPHAERR